MPCLMSRLSAGLVLAGLLTLSTAQAADGPVDALDVAGGEAPVLTSTHMPQPVRDIPASVTILSADMLALYGFQGLAESMRLVAGASPDRLAGANYSLPVAGRRATGPIRVTLLVDGIEVGGAVLSEDDDWNDLPVALSDVERIEVSTGAGAAGYGRASKVAVVNFVTKHPADVERGYGAISLGSFESVRAMVRGGWSFGPASVRLTVQHRQREAIDDRRAFTPGDDAVGVDRVTMRTALAVAEGSNLSFDAAFLNSRYEGEPEAARPLGPRDLRNGYAALLWTQSLNPENDVSVRLEQWANTSREFPVACDAARQLCPPDDVNIERRTKFEIQDVQRLSEHWRVSAGLGFRQAVVRLRETDEARWSARYRRVFGSVDWTPTPSWSVGAGWSADEADSDNHDRTWNLGANWHLSETQTLRWAFSRGDWASDQALRIGTSGALTSQERMRSTELGYRLESPARGASVQGRLFWSKVDGRVWRPRLESDSPANGEFYGVELRAAGDLSDNWSGFVSATVLTEGDHSGAQDDHRARPWLGAAGVAVNLGEGWRGSLGYYASSRFGSSTQNAGRTAITATRDFRWSDWRWQLVLNARLADHLRARAGDGSSDTPHTATAWTFFASLAAAF
ncbi:TonB-dependent receptor plug domain-containing protein [Ideonella sp. DXS29W]|uniref:TonB-dependent receptor plug domain-containing protein n=1 Tax=Ideonella lacteola TaxID=2984193 RepID=A0ABU9BXN8_9BURK